MQTTASTTSTPPAEPRPEAAGPAADSALSLHVALSALAGIVLTLLWGITGAGYFWPAWVWLGLAIPVAIHGSLLLARRRPPGRDRNTTFKLGLGATAGAIVLVVWALSGAHGFWPIWPLLGISAYLGARILVTYADRLPLLGGRQQLAERVDVLTRTREGALSVQAAELRRIERDLHDGAQARLVALSMLLGRAEERLGDRPEAAELVRRARDEAGAAIAELRDLARGIAPPVLADRGLAAAVEALGRRSAIAVTVDAHIDERPIPVVETAAYFVVAEALTNAAKHGAGASARVRLAQRDERLIVEVSDDGPGGADPDGAGLTGLRHRVEALDGTLGVTSPEGLGTLVRAELPCLR
jgi:signal transduction histidine kinase